MIVRTRNSTYEIEDSKIRCLSTTHPEKDTRITEDWKPYTMLMGPSIGGVMRIIWDDDCMTTTSIVVDIEDDELTRWAV